MCYAEEFDIIIEHTSRGACSEHLENYIVQKIEEETRSKFEGASARGEPVRGF